MQKIVPGQSIQKGLIGTQVDQAAKMSSSPPTHFFVKYLDPKRFEYKFRVDGNWRYAPDQ